MFKTKLAQSFVPGVRSEPTELGGVITPPSEPYQLRAQLPEASEELGLGDHFLLIGTSLKLRLYEAAELGPSDAPSIVRMSSGTALGSDETVRFRRESEAELVWLWRLEEEPHL